MSIPEHMPEYAAAIFQYCESIYRSNSGNNLRWGKEVYPNRYVRLLFKVLFTGR